MADKPAAASNGREHVIPQAFGTFDTRNLTLKCVCDDCNAVFSREIDLKFARDSIEGLTRFWSGMKSTSEFKSIGKKSTTTVRFAPGSVQGALGYLDANPDGAELRVFAFPQVGFHQPPAPVKWFLVDELPEKDAIGAHGIHTTRGFEIQVREIELARAAEILRAKGYTKLSEVEIREPVVETVDTTTVGIVGRPEMRAATKIAMNYLAAIAGPGIVRTAPFDAARWVVRDDVGPTLVNVSENPWYLAAKSGGPRRGHYLALQTMPSGRIVAQVCLMLKLRYVVHLMSANFVTWTPTLSNAHFFDLDTRRIEAIPVPPLVPARRLNPAARTRHAPSSI